MKPRAQVKGVPYTRRKYMRGFPPPKINKFTMGNPTASFEYQVSLISKKDAQISHNALEAARIGVNRLLEGKLGRENYCLQIAPYPHHILRENKMIFGAHADRLQDGMRKAFGKPIGTAARIKADQAIIRVTVNEDGIDVAKEALKRGGIKLPMVYRINIEKAKEEEKENV